MSAKDYITEEKKKELLAELKYLQVTKRKELLEVLAYAKSLGDLKENAEYHQVREDQAKLEERIAKIEKILQESQILPDNDASTGVVSVNSKVSVLKDGEKEERVYHLVGSEEADMSKNKISFKSPFGQALMGKKVGDNVSFKTPNGVASYKILKVF